MNGYEFQSDFAKHHNSLGRQDGVAEGMNLGIVNGARLSLIALLQDKFGALDQSMQHRIEAADREQVMLWTRRVLAASTLDDVFAVDITQLTLPPSPPLE